MFAAFLRPLSSTTLSQPFNYFLKHVLIHDRRGAKAGAGAKSGRLIPFPAPALHPPTPNPTAPPPPGRNQFSGSRAGCWLVGGQDQSISPGSDTPARPWEGGGARRSPALRGVRSGAERAGPCAEPGALPSSCETRRGCRAGGDIVAEKRKGENFKKKKKKLKKAGNKNKRKNQACVRA